VTVPKRTELESRIADVLHHDAEIAMRSADTETRYDDMFASIDTFLRRRRVTWGVGAVAAAAALVIAVVLGGMPGLSSDRADPLPPARDRTPVEIATDFVDALAARDSTRASQDVEVLDGFGMAIWPGDRSMRGGLAWAEAAGFTVVPKDCARELRVRGRTIVRCPFDYQFLGSDRLGQGPYSGELSIAVADGRIIFASMASPPWQYGLFREVDGPGNGLWGRFVAWLEQEHPHDIPAMFTVTDSHSFGGDIPVWTDQSRVLWANYVDEWVTSQQ